MKSAASTSSMPFYDPFKEFIRYSELKQLVYNITFLQQQKMFRSLTVLSCFPGEGKTLFSAALAMAYADTCRSRVLVVDTGTLQHKKSLNLRDCIDPRHALVENLSLEDLKENPHRLPLKFTPASGDIPGPTVEPDVVMAQHPQEILVRENDLSLIKKLSDEDFNQFGLVLLDTVPLSAKNKSNLDPLLVARLSDASVLVVSPKLLNSPEVGGYMKILDDSSLHLLGMVSNELYHP